MFCRMERFVTLGAGNQITFGPGFEARQGSELWARIRPDDDVAPNIIDTSPTPGSVVGSQRGAITVLVTF